MTKTKSKPTNKHKGQKKEDIDPKDNPLLKVKDNPEFIVESMNILNDVYCLMLPGYESFDLESNPPIIDTNKLNNNSELKVIVTYYEYMCMASFRYSYIIPLLDSDISGKDVFNMIKHHLKTKLLFLIPSVDSVYEMEIKNMIKIKYNN